MTNTQTALKTSGATLLALSLSSPALADVDPQAVLAALSEQLTLQSIELSAESAQLEGSNNVVLSGVTLDFTGDDDGVKVDRILLEDVAERPNGGYMIGRMGAPAFSTTDDGITVEFDGAAIEGYYVAGPNETNPILNSGMFSGLEIGPVQVSSNSGPIFEFDGLSASISPYEEGGTLEMSGEMRDFYVNFQNGANPEAARTMSSVGYGELRGRGSGEGSWNLTTGRLEGTQTITVDDAATLNIAYDIGGYTPELVAAIQQMQTEMAQQDDAAMNMAMMGMMQQIEINSLSIEIVDDSATHRILDYVAEQQGQNRASMVAQMKGMMPFALAQLNAPDFAAKVTAAVGSYLENPDSIRVEAAPANPVPVAQIMAGAMSAPQTLIQTLGLDITSNE